MIVVEHLQSHPGLVKRYSDKGRFIQNNQTGIKYLEAVDIDGLHDYTETDEFPEKTEDENISQLLQSGIVVFPPPEPEEPDYFNENEPEPDYFNA